MAIGFASRGTTANNTSSTTIATTPSANFTAGSWAAVFISADNSSGGGSTNNITTVEDSIGNTWTERVAGVFDNGNASAGVQGSWWTTPQDVGTITTSTTITVTFGNNTVAKGFHIWEITKGATENLSFITGDAAAGQASTTSPTVTTVTITSGDGVLAGVAGEAGTTQVQIYDTDTTNGTWSGSGQYHETGSTTSGNVGVSQYKITTATATQTYAPTWGFASDSQASYIVMHAEAGATTYNGSFTADANIKKLDIAGSFTADANVRKNDIAGSATADAYIKKLDIAGTFTADSNVSKTDITGSFTADAEIGDSGVGVPTWVSPADTATIVATPVLVFTIPTGPVGNYHFHLQLDTANTFDTGNLRNIKTNVSVTGWEYWNGSAWTAMPSTGVASTYAGNEARYTVQTALSTGFWYRRIRAGV